jgi:signal transduction histidine kinase
MGKTMTEEESRSGQADAPSTSSGQALRKRAEEEKEKRAAELVIANKELMFQNEEKEKRAAELVIANAHLEKLTSENKRTEAELLMHRERLEQLVHDRTAQLEAAQEELLRKARLATLGQLVAMVSHEMRNPLGTIRSSIFSVSERVKGRDENVDRALARAERNIKRCDNIIEELLSHTRSQPPNLTATDLDGWLAEAVDEVPIPEGIQLTKKFSCGVELLIDRERLRRCVINVIDNACQAMSGNKGGRASLLTVETSVADDRVKIQVRDTGPGIPAGLLEKVFEPLYSTKTFGVGLGLSIVKQILEQHAGGVEVESREGEGALVTLWLPRGEQEVQVAQASHSSCR